MRTRKQVLEKAELIWEASYKDVQLTAHYNRLWESMQYLRRNVKTKGLQFSLYKGEFDYFIDKINEAYKEISFRGLTR